MAFIKKFSMVILVVLLPLLTVGAEENKDIPNRSTGGGKNSQNPIFPGKQPVAQSLGTDKNPAFVRVLPADLQPLLSPTVQNPVIVKVLPPENQADKDREDQKRENRKERNDKQLVGFTAALFIATSALFIATLALWGATRKLYKGAEDTAERQLRAYVMMTQGVVENVLLNQASSSYQFNLTIKNTGLTPAYQTRCSAVASVIDENGDPPPPTDDFHSRLNLGSGVEGQVLAVYPNLITRDLTEIQAERKRIVVVGKIKYEDIYGKTRTENYCLAVPNTISGGDRLFAYHKGNVAG